MNKKCFILLVFITFRLFSQEIVIDGKVTDSLYHPLPFANVMAESINKKQAPVFTMTDEAGHYELQLLKKLSYRISILYMGYQSESFKVDSLSDGFRKNVILKPRKNQLDEVIVVADLPVKVKQDTIEYKTGRFITGEERKLKDVLKKLPGVEVDKKGMVTVMGKKVNKVLVEGKEFFGGGTKLAVDNIPADAVDKVVAIDDYNSIGFMKGLTDEQKMIIDIKLKEGKKHFVFGDVVGGVGNNKHHLAKANLFYYSPKTNLSYIGNLNDTGETPMDMGDFIRFEGGLNDLGKLKSSFQNFKWISGMIIPENFVDKKDKFSALQWQQDFDHKIEFSTYAIFSDSEIATERTDYNQYLNELSLTEIRNIEQKRQGLTGLGKLHFRYKSSVQNYLDVELSGNFQETLSGRNLQSIINQENKYVVNKQNQNNYNLQNNIAWRYKINKKNTFRLLNNLTYIKDIPDDIWQTDKRILSHIIPLQITSPYLIKQNQKNDKKEWNIELKHYWIINKNNHIYTSIGNHLLRQIFYTETFQALQNEQINDFSSAGFNNDLKLNLEDAFFGLQYKSKLFGAIIKIGLFGHYYVWNMQQNDNKFKAKFNLLPELSIRKKIKYSQTLEFIYQLKSNIPEASKYLNHYHLTDFTSVHKGNPDLTNELSHNFRLLYSDFSFSKSYQYHANLHYQYKQNPIKSKTYYYGIDTYRNPVMASLPESSFSASIYFKKNFNKAYVSVNPMWQYKDYSQNIQNRWKNIRSVTQNYKLTYGTYFKKYPNFDMGIFLLLNDNIIDKNKNRYMQIAPFFEASYDFLKGFIFKGDYQYVTSKDNKNKRNDYQTAGLSLYYQKENNPWGFELSVSNLFNHSFINSNSQTNILLSNSNIYVQPRIWMFKLRYKL